jgi:transcriptional regulator with XRE-family HTH domain
MGIVGSRLRELREEKGFSKMYMGKALGISRTAYIQYENSNTAHPRKLDELAKMFNVSVDYLLGLTDERNPSCVPSEHQTPTENGQLLDSFNNAPTHIKAAIMTLLAPYEK